MNPPGPVIPDAASPARGREVADLKPRLIGRALALAPAFRNQFLIFPLFRYFELFTCYIPVIKQKTDFLHLLYRKPVFVSIIKRLRL